MSRLLRIAETEKSFVSDGRRCWPGVVAAALAVMVYFITIRGVYIYDDVPLIQNDPRMNSTEKMGADLDT